MHIVLGFSACLGVSRHATNDPEFIAAYLDSLGIRHDRPLDLVEVMANEDPLDALWLLQVCGVRRLAATLSALSPILLSLSLRTHGTRQSQQPSRRFNRNLRHRTLHTRFR